jgi:hypothetical protein
MALAITPAVSGRKLTWTRDICVYAISAGVGGLLTLCITTLGFGLMAGLSGRHVAVLVVLTVAVGAALRDLGLPVPLPYRNRQVPSGWRTSIPHTGVAAGVYGLVLGFGFATLYTSSLHVTFAALAPATMSGRIILGTAGAYALGKVVPLMVGLGTRTHDEVLVRVVGARQTSPRRAARRAAAALVSLALAAAVARGSL